MVWILNESLKSRYLILALFFVGQTGCASSGVMTYAIPDRSQLPPLRNEQGDEAFMPVDLDFQGRKLPSPLRVPLTEGGVSSLSKVRSLVDEGFAQGDYWIITDRGPNMEIKGRPLASDSQVKFPSGARFFPVPNYVPALFRVHLNESSRTFELVERIGLSRAGIPLNGLPSNVQGKTTDETAWKSTRDLASDNQYSATSEGYDFEGLIEDQSIKGAQRAFWASDEYGPSLVKIDGQGRVIEDYIPGDSVSKNVDGQLKNTLSIGDTPPSVDRVNNPPRFDLPVVLRHRKDNRGFEGLAATKDFVFAIVQSPLDAKGGRSGQKGHGNKKTRLHRFLRLDKVTRVVDMFAYEHIENAKDFGVDDSDVKIGDMVALDSSGTRFLVLEHDGEKGYAHLNYVTLSKETTRLDPAKGVVYEAGTEPVRPLAKRLIADLTPTFRNLRVPAKAEGLTLLDNQTVLVAFDNDYCFETKNGFILAIPDETCRTQFMKITLDSPLDALP